MLCWGKATDGQLGLGEGEAGEKHVLVPRENPFFSVGQSSVGQDRPKISDIASCSSRSVVATADGSVYTFGKETGQDKKPTPGLFRLLETQCVRWVACGSGHTVVVTDQGQLYSWGDNSRGQLGHGSMEGTPRMKPRPVQPFSPPEKVVQVSCGMEHTLALLQDGRVFAWGSNTSGQLGVASREKCAATPVELKLLKGLPLSQVVCGGYHSFGLSVSGALYGWGRNSCGQLGLGTEEDCYTPTLVQSLRNLKPKYVACGEEHTAVLTEEGGVFTCGCASHGQLGHGNCFNASRLRMVFELTGTAVAQVACGRWHTLVLLRVSGRVYSCGRGSNGQLGTGTQEQCTTPKDVKGTWSGGRGTPVDSNDCRVRLLAAGAESSFAVLARDEEASLDFTVSHPKPQPAYFSLERISSLAQAQDSQSRKELLRTVELFLASPSCISGSFLSEDHFSTSTTQSGVDMTQAKQGFTIIASLYTPAAVRGQFVQCFNSLLDKSTKQPIDVECVRVFLTMTASPIFNVKELERVLDLFIKYCQVLNQLNPKALEDLSGWCLHSERKHFVELISLFVNTLNTALSKANPYQENGKEKIASSPREKEQLYRVLQFGLPVLHKFNEWNKTASGDDRVVRYTSFYLPAIHQMVDLMQDYLTWRRNEPNTVSFCMYPFTMDAACKARLLEVESSLLMHFTGANEMAQNLHNGGYICRPFLDVVVGRKSVLEDALRQLRDLPPQQLKKQLKVSFHGEEGDDEGGVRKEFFMLVLREIMNPAYGLFQEDEESHLIWFSDSLIALQVGDDLASYGLVGMLCGLAIYNNVVVDLPFPSALYKMLLGRQPDLSDLTELKPSVGQGLQKLLKYTEGRIEEDFGLTFEVTRRVFGEVMHHSLVPGGASIPVTMDNRHDYVQSYVKFVLVESVKAPYDAFRAGFRKVCDGSEVLSLFHYKELMAVVRGKQVVNFGKLEEIVQYHGGYHKDHPVIRTFWKVFHALPQEGKRKFLVFLTGSDRIPVAGLESLRVIIQHTDGGPDGQRLPVAHTCFNVLDLPPYGSEEVMKQKLLQAINFTEGFGLI